MKWGKGKASQHSDPGDPLCSPAYYTDMFLGFEFKSRVIALKSISSEIKSCMTWKIHDILRIATSAYEVCPRELSKTTALMQDWAASEGRIYETFL